MRLRERLRSRFVSIIAGAGAALEARERPADALTVYERGPGRGRSGGRVPRRIGARLSKLGRVSEADSARYRRVKLAPAGLA